MSAAIWVCRPRAIVISFGGSKAAWKCIECRQQIGNKCKGPEAYIPPSEVGHPLVPIPFAALADMKTKAVREALKLTKGNKLHSARLLGIAVKTLYRMMAKAGIPK